MMFHDYLKDVPVNGFRKALIELFRILDTKVENRDKYLAEENPRLAAFPYVNGGLFANETIEIPMFTEEIKTILLNKASADFDWSDISPTIFGAVFESTLNPETRRRDGTIKHHSLWKDFRCVMQVKSKITIVAVIMTC